MALRPLLLGPPLVERGDGAAAAAAADDGLGPYMDGIRALLRRTYGEGPEAAQADAELATMLERPPGAEATACRRALLLFAMHREPEVAAHFAQRDGDGYARDMAERVLPFVTPRFLANQCQCPDAYVLLSLVLAEMWPGERLGNWPRGEKAAHHDLAVAGVRHARDGEGA